MYQSINRKTKSALLSLGLGVKCPTYAPEALDFHPDVALKAKAEGISLTKGKDQ